jgi:hypothetical protein
MPKLVCVKTKSETYCFNECELISARRDFVPLGDEYIEIKVRHDTETFFINEIISMPNIIKEALWS